MQGINAETLTKLCILPRYFKAFALTGREVCVRDYPGRCPGLGASALSGRVAQTCEILGVNAADTHARCFIVLCELTVR